MTKLVFVTFSRDAKVAPKQKRARKSEKHRAKKLTIGRNARTGKFLTVDADSATFGEELEQAFVRSVRKARRENKRIFGTPDIAPRKA